MNDASGDPLIGQLAGNYRLVRVLGEGGFGRVYLAEHPELGGRMAVKTLHRWVIEQHPEIAKRFLTEARTGSRQLHPRIIRVVDFGRFSDGAPWLMMEFLEGYDVAKLVERQGPLSLPVALSILAQTCEGLHVAHEHGIVHRDLKPQNLFVLDPSGEVKILDFGIAKVTDESISGDLRTRTGQAAGSFGFMAPEQARSMARTDRRADIFSLGAIAYYVLTGQLPFTGETITDYAMNIMNSAPPDPRLLRPDLPAGWMFAITQALGREPSDRPQTAVEFVRRLIPDVPGGVDIVRRVAPSLLDVSPSAMTMQPRADVDLSAPPTTASGTAFAAAHTHTPTQVGRGRTALFIAAGVGVAAAVIVTIAVASGRHGAATAIDSDAAVVRAVAPIDATTVSVAPADAAIAVDSAQAAAVPPADAAMTAAATPVDAGAPMDASAAGSAIRPVGFGTLAVHVSPWATVFVDGRRVGSTPISTRLAAGKHKVLLVNEDSGKREVVNVVVVEGRPTSIDRDW